MTLQQEMKQPFDYLEEDTTLQLNQTPKLPFDINDYLNFELNEDLVSSSGFLNDYTPAQQYNRELEADYLYCSAHSDQSLRISRCQTSYGLEQELIQDHSMSDCVDITLENDEFLVDNASFENDLNEFHPESRVSADLSATSGYILHSKQTSDDDFRIFRTDHMDFRCSVLNKYGRFCENKIDCAMHSLEQKSRVERSDTTERLIRNFKYLQNLKEDILEYSKQLSSKALNDNNYQPKQPHRSGYSYDLKRHNSYQSNQCFKTLDPTTNKDSGQFYNQPIQILNSIFKEEDTFANLLTTKLLEINPDPHIRITEFHYKLKLKNLATLTFYQ